MPKFPNINNHQLFNSKFGFGSDFFSLKKFDQFMVNSKVWIGFDQSLIILKLKNERSPLSTNNKMKKNEKDMNDPKERSDLNTNGKKKKTFKEVVTYDTP